MGAMRGRFIDICFYIARLVLQTERNNFRHKLKLFLSDYKFERAKVCQDFWFLAFLPLKA